MAASPDKQPGSSSTAKRRREQRVRSEARHVGWLTGMLLSHCSHHTTSGGVGELPTPSGLLAQLQSLCQRVSAIEQELQHFVHGDAEQAKAPDKSVGQGKEDESQHFAQGQEKQVETKKETTNMMDSGGKQHDGTDCIPLVGGLNPSSPIGGIQAAPKGRKEGQGGKNNCRSTIASGVTSQPAGKQALQTGTPAGSSTSSKHIVATPTLADVQKEIGEIMSSDRPPGEKARNRLQQLFDIEDQLRGVASLQD